MSHLARSLQSCCLALMLSVPLTALAALPGDVAGTPMPSLAPMLETVTPAVVNIHSKTVVKVRSPFADDPYFRQFFGLPDAPQERIALPAPYREEPDQEQLEVAAMMRDLMKKLRGNTAHVDE